jgi:ubiquitin-like modifier-activating enzyme ATG7
MYTTPLKYVAFESEIELAFYSALNTVKIDHDRLDAPTRRVVGLYEAPISVTGDSCRIRVQGNAMNLEQ